MPHSLAKAITNLSSKDNLDRISEVVHIYLDQATIYCSEKRWEKAINACQEILKIAPNTAEAYKVLGNIFQCTEQNADAMGAYAKALLLEPSFAEVYTNIGSLYAKEKQWKQAVKYYQKSICVDPDFAGAYLYLAKVQNCLHQKKEEIKYLSYALKIDPNLGTAYEHYQLGNRLLNEGETEEASLFYQHAIARKSDFREAYEKLAELLENSGDWKAAVKYYRKVLELSPLKEITEVECKSPILSQKNTKKNNSKILSSSTIAQIKENEKIYSVSITKDEANSSVNISKKKDFLKKTDDENRIQKLLELSCKNPNSEDIKFRIANIYAGCKNYIEAINFYRESIEINSEMKEAHYNLAKVLSRIGQNIEAANCLFQAFSIDTTLATADQHYILGNYLLNNEQNDKAIICYQRAIDEKEDFIEATNKLREALAKKNSNRENVTAEQKILIGTPENTSVIDHTNLSIDSPSKDELQDDGRALVTLDKINSSKTDQTSDVSFLTEDDIPPTNNNSDAAQSIRLNYSLAMEKHKYAESLEKQENWKAAALIYQQAIEKNSNFSWSHHNLGICQQNLQNWVAASTAYKYAIELNPTFFWSKYNLAEVLEKLECWEESANLYRNLLEKEPSNSLIPPRLANIVQLLLKQYPRSVDLYIELGNLMIAQNKIGAGLISYHMALQIQPSNQKLAIALSSQLKANDPCLSNILLERVNKANTQHIKITRVEELKDIKIVKRILFNSSLFDPIYYRLQNPELPNDTTKLIDHYLNIGIYSGCSPNPLFNNEYYQSTYPEITKSAINGLAHYSCIGYKKGYNPHPKFNTQQYQNTNTDVQKADINPLEHYLNSGAKEGRVAFLSSQFSQILDNQPNKEYLRYWKHEKELNELALGKRIGIYCSSQSTYFIVQLADFISVALEKAGHIVLRLNELDKQPDYLDSYWIIAPHEFFYLNSSKETPYNIDWLTNAVMVNVEQPQTSWFSKAFHYMRHARRVIDINVKSAAILQELGLPSYWLPLGNLDEYLPLVGTEKLQELPSLRCISESNRVIRPHILSPLKERPIDIHFVGTSNLRREQFFVKSADWLNQYTCFIHMQSNNEISKSRDHYLDSNTFVGLSRRSKILLNIHRDEIDYFEWHRLVFYGLWQNTLVVTEPCHKVPLLQEGIHYIACTIELMEEKIQWLLKTNEGQLEAEKIRSAGKIILKEYRLKNIIHNFLF